MGTQILVCNNGLITGEFVLCKRHTTGLDLSDAVNRGVDRFIDQSRHVSECIDQMKARGLTEHESDHLLMEAGRRRLLPWSHIGQVQEEYARPSFKEFDERSGWGLYNAFTRVAQKSTPERQLRALNRFRQIVLN